MAKSLIAAGARRIFQFSMIYSFIHKRKQINTTMIEEIPQVKSDYIRRFSPYLFSTRLCLIVISLNKYAVLN